MDIPLSERSDISQTFPREVRILLHGCSPSLTTLEIGYLIMYSRYFLLGVTLVVAITRQTKMIKNVAKLLKCRIWYTSFKNLDEVATTTRKYLHPIKLICSGLRQRGTWWYREGLLSQVLCAPMGKVSGPTIEISTVWLVMQSSWYRLNWDSAPSGADSDDVRGCE